MPYQTAKDMIDTTALTALITAFRAEVTQNSISPEKVGSILQQIADLLATATPDSDMSEFTVLRQRFMAHTQNLGKLYINVVNLQQF